MTENWICSYCLNTVENNQEPKHCPHCKITECEHCHSYIRNIEPYFCHGCGKIGGTVYTNFVRSSSTASVYMEDEWCRRNSRTKKSFCYCTGLDGSYLAEWIDSKIVKVRDLTEEELKTLKKG